jgi:hypothetical protein
MYRQLVINRPNDGQERDEQGDPKIIVGLTDEKGNVKLINLKASRISFTTEVYPEILILNEIVRKHNLRLVSHSITVKDSQVSTCYMLKNAE